MIRVELTTVVLAVESDRPVVLTLSGGRSLPTGSLREAEDRTLELGVRRLVSQQLDQDLGYVEQLYTFGDLQRVPDGRLLSIAYLALVGRGHHSEGYSVYTFFPWEDWRGGRPTMLEPMVENLRTWARGDSDRETRLRICFGLDGTPWNQERVLERFELLYEVGLVEEASQRTGFGRRMDLDHRRILATALTRVRGKIRYRPVVFELLPLDFTLLELQRTVEALAGIRLHKQNFRRMMEKQGLVEGTGRLETGGRGRPAELFSFRSDVLTERPATGVALPRRKSR